MIKKACVWTDITLPADGAMRLAEDAVCTIRNGLRENGYVTHCERCIAGNGNICYEITAVKEEKEEFCKGGTNE